MNVTNGWIMLYADNINYDIDHKFFETKEKAINAMKEEVNATIEGLKKRENEYVVYDDSKDDYDASIVVVDESDTDIYYWHVKKLIED